MKKTLFLSAILGAALCSSAFGAETITVDGTSYTAALVNEAQATNPDSSVHAYLINYDYPADAQATVRGDGTMNPWIKDLTSADTLIIAASDDSAYSMHNAFIDSNGTKLTINANLLVGGDNNLRFWSQNQTDHTILLNGDMTIAHEQANLYLQNGMVEHTGALIGSDSQVLHVTQNSGSSILRLSGDKSQFSGQIKVDGGKVQFASSSIGLGYNSGSVLKFNEGVLDEAASTINFGTSWSKSATKGSDGRYQIVKNTSNATLNAGSEAEVASVTTSGSDGGWILLGATGDTEHNVYTDIILNSTANNAGAVISAANTTTHIGALSGTSSAALVSGANGQGGNRTLVLHQSTNTTFAGKFTEVSKYGTDETVRDIQLVKKGTGTLTMTNVNTSRSGLVIEEGGVTFSGSGAWSGSDITVNGGTLTLNTTGSFKNIVNNGTVAVLSAVHGEVVSDGGRTENGYSITHDVVTINGTGTLSGTGTWTVNGVTATLTGDRTLEADVLDTTKYYVDKTDAAYDGSLKDKYVVGEGRKLTVSGNQTWVTVAENHGTIVADGMTGFFSAGKNLGNLEVTGNGLTLDNGFTQTTTFANLSGNGTIKVTNSAKGPKERFEITGDVADTISFASDRVNSASETTFAFTKADVENVSVKAITNGGTKLNFEAAALTTESLTLNGGTLGVYLNSNHNIEANEAALTTTTMTVNADSNLNANLVIADQGTVTFNSGTVTLGCSVTFGEGSTVALGTAYLDDLAANGKVLLFTDVESYSDNIESILVTGDFVGGHLLVESYTAEGGATKFNIYATPEPATATLSLLALAGLMARRKRH